VAQRLAAALLRNCCKLVAAKLLGHVWRPFGFDATGCLFRIVTTVWDRFARNTHPWGAGTIAGGGCGKDRDQNAGQEKETAVRPGRHTFHLLGFGSMLQFLTHCTV
jgi:hypothetical protein